MFDEKKSCILEFMMLQLISLAAHVDIFEP